MLDAATALALALEATEQSGVQAVSALDERYPTGFKARLGRAAPPILYTVGDLDLFGQDALGIVGSRAVDDDGADIAGVAAREAVAHGWGVVSGGAKGVDRLAMHAALEAGGSVSGVLADSLSRTVKDAEVRRAITAGSLCLITPYKPSAGFSVANAMGRNKLIYALSTGTLVVASDLEKGGTWGGAVEALKQRIAPVLVWRGPGGGQGNERLVELGAVHLVWTESAAGEAPPEALTAELPPGFLLPVDVAPMTDPDDLDDEPVVEHLVDDAVVADAHSVGVRFTGHRHASRWSGVLSQEIDRGADPLLFAPRQRSHRLDGAAGNLDAVRRHTRPRSALTSSQGT